MSTRPHTVWHWLNWFFKEDFLVVLKLKPLSPLVHIQQHIKQDIISAWIIYRDFFTESTGQAVAMRSYLSRYILPESKKKSWKPSVKPKYFVREIKNLAERLTFGTVDSSSRWSLGRVLLFDLKSLLLSVYTKSNQRGNLTRWFSAMENHVHGTIKSIAYYRVKDSHSASESQLLTAKL